nr:ABC transporter permease [Kocuria sp. CNJ-770]
MTARPPAARPWWTVTAREIAVKLRDRSFLLSTAATLVLVAASIAASALLGDRAAEHVVATAGPEAAPVTARAAQALADAGEATLTVHSAGSADAARAAVAAESADAALLLELDGWTVVGRDGVDPGLGRALEQAVADATLAANARAAGTTAEELTAGAEVRTELLAGGTDRGPVRLAMGFAFALLFYLSAVVFGMAVAHSVLEEKQNRVVEILATAVPVRQLLHGKVLGNCLLAFGQIALYAVVGLVGVNVAGTAADVGWALAPPAGSWPSSWPASPRRPPSGPCSAPWPPAPRTCRAAPGRSWPCSSGRCSWASTPRAPGSRRPPTCPSSPPWPCPCGCSAATWPGGSRCSPSP